MRTWSHGRGRRMALGALAVGAALVGTLSCRAQADTCTIVSGGKPAAAIVVADSAFPVDSLAAQELQYHIERATGAKLAIYSESRRPANATGLIYIGACRETERKG